MPQFRHTPLSLAELKKLRVTRNVNVEHFQGLSKLERFAVFVTRRVGTMGFFLILCIWTVGWITWNAFAPASLRFDPFPSFVLWLFISNMIQLFLLPLIMIGQNLDARHAEARAEADFHINVRAEREIETILQHLENQSGLVLEILRRLEEKNSADKKE